MCETEHYWENNITQKNLSVVNIIMQINVINKTERMIQYLGIQHCMQ